MDRKEALRQADELLLELIASGEFSEGRTQEEVALAGLRARERLANEILEAHHG